MSSGAPLNVVIVEDDPRYRESLIVLLSLDPRLRLLETFGSATAAVARLEATRPPEPLPTWDLILMDLDLPGLNGIEGIRRIKPCLPGALVVVLTVFEEPARILEAICAGADGYLLKRTPAARTPGAASRGGGRRGASHGRSRAHGARVDPRSRRASRPARRDGPPAGGPPLSVRERDVLRGLVAGLAYKQVADHLDLSIDTVRTHVRGLYRKLQVHSVAEAVVRALREGLV